MKLRDDDTLEPGIARELEAIDAALRGAAVDPDLAGLGELTTDLSALRPNIEEPFAAGLDARIAGGFKSAKRRESASGIAGAWERFRSAAPARRLMPVGAVALAALAVVTAVIATGDGSSDPTNLAGSSTSPASTSASSQGAASDAGAAQAGAAAQASTAEALPAPQAAQSRSSDSKAPATGPFASDQNHRAIERDAQLTLGTDPEKVQGVSEDVLGVVGRYEGIVLSSSVSDGPAGDAGAQFDLLIPSDRLGDALTDLSGVAEVRSREERTTDITAPTVTTQEHLRDARAEVEGLLKQLANADTDEERRSAEGQLALQRRRIAGLRSTLNSLQRRANLSHVSLDIVTGDASSFGDTGDGRWTVGDALRDAGHILGTAAALTLVALAILAPFALLALLAWLARRGWVGQSRRRALEG